MTSSPSRINDCGMVRNKHQVAKNDISLCGPEQNLTDGIKQPNSRIIRLVIRIDHLCSWLHSLHNIKVLQIFSNNYQYVEYI